MNKAITKRLLSLVLLVVMLVGCALPAYAADTGASGDLTAVYAQEGTSYKDGVYEGTGKGFKNGEIKVKVTITDGKIAKVELVSQEKQSYWETMNVASLFDDIVKANGTEIDGVSGGQGHCAFYRCQHHRLVLFGAEHRRADEHLQRLR